jgi:prepilin-type N-terminal cleavage/methylation domain-containing protein
MLRYFFMKTGQQKPSSTNGFTMVELMVVLVIAGILATGIIMMFSDPTGKVKVVGFETRGDINLARAVAVKENEDVRIDFNFGTLDGYRVWMDDWDDGASAVGSPPQDGVYTEDDPSTSAKDGDTLVKNNTFMRQVQFYEFGGATPADGPANDPLGTALSPGNGITFGTNTLTMSSNGTVDSTGAIVIYYPLQGSPGMIRGKPYAIVLDNMTTGRVQIQRWRDELNDWSRK